ncbi:MAG: methyl-accepting chemotaxis protein [Anaerovibrio sp.]|uniref:methyl-accepting chemotaxis protein n=1 Tax=Anaerovibrio sp. TaxID=1872532 RepID=UPI002601DEC7|nr:methyl-accepting chemotaxis protein [Anaerovibrio sp.]MDD7678717.1 methyl-accepting chemotaxis protein [Anaerovibrio sp.]MDY2603984.1 methyl-accepting chemotaxis protein [Anaerovibrio sp.]MDY4884189.1 methyl-accepting chemotaxis protein [Anaerovibrio sp.]
MMLFKNMKIGTKLMIFMVIMELLIVGVAYHGITVARDTDATYREIMADDVAASANAYEMGMHFQHARANMLLVLRSDDPAKKQEYTAAMEKNLDEADECLKVLQQTAKSDQAKTEIATLTTAYNNFRQSTASYLRQQAVQPLESGTRTAATTNYVKSDEAIADKLHEIADMGYDSAKKRDIAISEKLDRDVIAIIMVALAMVLASAAAGILFNRDVKNRLIQLSESADRIADGDLATEVVTSTGDELGDAAASFEIMRQRIREVLVEINHGADQVAAGAQNVSDASVALSQGASEQAASVEQLSASISEIASQTASNAQNAEKANELTVGTRSRAEMGNQEMQEMLAAMEEINASSVNISKIIKVIDEIAFQTNILALNAAVEAARAGQHGKGFAVVAEEVRNLAARSAKAAKETTDMIEGSMEKVEAGRGIAHKTAQALSEIVGDVASVADIVASIAKASNEQKLALEQINQGVQQVSQVVQSNSSTSEEAATASQHLSAQADSMKANVGKFRLGNIGSSFRGGASATRMAAAPARQEAVQRPVLSESGAVKPAKPGVKPKTIALTDDEGFGKY